MKSQYLYVANLKSYLTAEQEIQEFKNYVENINLNDENIIFCPSFLSLYTINNINSINKKFIIGAQNCSQFTKGAYTGEISAESLKELNIRYCIVGHSERRQYFNETNEIISNKIELILQNNLTPILCIGETKEEFESKKTKDILTDQLSILPNPNEVLIAYEPRWSISSGKVPDITYINEIYQFISKLLNNKTKILYGGSVNAKFAKILKQETHLDGFLIGKVSTDFQEFKNIVLS